MEASMRNDGGEGFVGPDPDKEVWQYLDGEPATGEDVKTVKAAIRSVTRDWMLDSDLDVIAPAILAALDLPGREQALRERLTEAEATIVRAQNALGSDHPVWWVLDDYNGSMTSVTELVAERDEARAALAAALAPETETT
jgi:hypothetical protein